MSQYVSERVDEVRNEPESGHAELVARIDSDELATVRDWLRDNGGRIQVERDYGLVQFLLPESSVDALCERAFVDSVESAAETAQIL